MAQDLIFKVESTVAAVVAEEFMTSEDAKVVLGIGYGRIFFLKLRPWNPLCGHWSKK